MHNFDVIARKRRAPQRRVFYEKGFWHSYRELVKDRYKETSAKGEWIHTNVLRALQIQEDLFEYEIQQASKDEVKMKQVYLATQGKLNVQDLMTYLDEP